MPTELSRLTDQRVRIKILRKKNFWTGFLLHVKVLTYVTKEVKLVGLL